MCEITDGKIYVADRDLVCYKIMLEKGEGLQSLHYEYEYKIGWEYRVNGFEYRCLDDDDIYEVWNRELSPFAGWGKCYSIFPYSSDITKTDLCYTRYGFYSYTYYGNGRMESDSERVIKVYRPNMIRFVRCRIPEGSKYMVSDSGEVFISERIVIDEAWSL
jgi:hypothetical protein